MKRSEKANFSQQLYKGMPKEITRLVESESDRGAILILGAYLEEILGVIVRDNCASDADADAMLEFRRPAGDFSSKITLCKAFALISPDEASALDQVRKTRNQAAHFDNKRGFAVLFDSPETVDQVAKLAKTLNHEVKLDNPKVVREIFIFLCRILAMRLFFRCVESSRPHPLPSHRERADAIRKALKGTPAGKRIDEIDGLAKDGKVDELQRSLEEIFQKLGSAVKKQGKSGSPNQ